MTMVNPSRFARLGAWYADPLPPEHAPALLERAQRAEARRLRHGRSCIACRLLRMLARHALGADIGPDYAATIALARGRRRARALTELVYGQLLASRRLGDAAAHLQRAFEDAAPLLAPDDYFALLRRRRGLAHLPLGEEPQPPATLRELLTTAAVVERLRRGRPAPRPAHDPNDTYG